jgi:polyhydroxybutyrate depolymerase
MSARTTRMKKEARALFRPWFGVVILCALPLFHIGRTLSETSIAFCYLGIPMLATLSLGYEFQHRTFSLLLAQPVSRMQIWGEKMSVALVAVLSTALVFCYGWRSTFQQDPKLWAVAGVYLLATVPSATFWTLFARSTIGGFLLNGIFPYILILAHWNEIFGPNPPAVRSINGLWITAFAALCYAGVMLWLGVRRLARFQVAGGMTGDNLLMAGSSMMPESLAGLFRCRPTGAVLNLIRKELRLLRPLWLISFLSLVYLTVLTLFRFLHLRDSTSPFPGGAYELLYIPVILFSPLVAILAGSLSLWEEKTSGTQSWHMTLPVSARRQWMIKLFIAIFTGLVCAVLLPVLVMVVLGLIFGTHFMFVDQAMVGLTIAGGSIGLAGGPLFGFLFLFVNQTIPGLLLTALLLTVAAFWCACAINGTVRTALWFVPAVGGLLLAGRCGGWIAPKLLDFVVSRFQPFSDFQFTNAVSNLHLQLFFLVATPLRVVTLLLVPTLLIAVIQSYRLFRAQLPDSILSVIRNLLPLAAVAFLSGFGLAAFASLNETNGTIVSSGSTRQYLLYVPKNYDRSKATPLIISLHPAATWPAAEMEISRWNELADEQGFIVVYPSGSDVPRVWPMGQSSLGTDVKFISDLIDKLEAAYNIDPNRIYADGMSNGGGMAFALSCRLSNRIAAVGAVAAAQAFLPVDQCGDSRPVPTVAFHGTADTFAPYQGGSSPVSPDQFPNIWDWTARVARRNQCSGDPIDARITASVHRLAYTNCANNADVILYTIEGGGHTWPGGKALPERIVGRTNREINATRVMWAFFVQHAHGPK